MLCGVIVAALLLLSCETAPVPLASKAKFLEAVVALAQNLAQWALLIVGGTLAIIVGTSYYRPKSARARSMYWLFVPAWLLLAVSIFNGSVIQRRYLAYLFLPPDSPVYQEILLKINKAVEVQLVTLECAFVFLGLWLLFYLYWWISMKEKERIDDI